MSPSLAKLTKSELVEEVERLQKILGDPEIGIRELLAKDGTLDMTLTAPPYVLMLMGETLRKVLDDTDAPNYVEAKIIAPAADGQHYVLRVERYFGKTPHQLRHEAEGVIERLAYNDKSNCRECGLQRPDHRKGCYVAKALQR